MENRVPLIIIGSSRQQSDTKSFVEYVFGDTTYKAINLLDFYIAPYSYEGIYPSNDEFNKVAEEMLQHEIIVFATPVYWYSMSALMKNLFDRLTDLVRIRKATGRLLKGKNIFLLVVGNDPEIPSGYEIPFKNTAEYLDMIYNGCIYSTTGDEPVNEEEKRAQSRKFMERLISLNTKNA